VLGFKAFALRAFGMSRLPSICTSAARDAEERSPCRYGTQSVHFTLRHVDVAKRVDFAHVFAPFVHHLIERLGLHL
jgi:hypothetical protein